MSVCVCVCARGDRPSCLVKQVSVPIRMRVHICECVCVFTLACEYAVTVNGVLARSYAWCVRLPVYRSLFVCLCSRARARVCACMFV